MAIIYEVNPPRTDPQETLDERISAQMSRVDEISSICDGIHVTDSVLGRRRASAISIASRIKQVHQNLQITVSMRTRDRDITEIIRQAEECAAAGISGILVLMGDPASDAIGANSNLVPSMVAGRLARIWKSDLQIYLSLPANPNFAKIQKKINAEPTGFVTQVIHTEQQAVRICDMLKPIGFRIVPCVLLPSAKNEASARFLGLDWSSYRNDPLQFARRIHDIAGDILITSPNDFAAARELLYRAKYSASG